MFTGGEGVGVPGSERQAHAGALSVFRFNIIKHFIMEIHFLDSCLKHTIEES